MSSCASVDGSSLLCVQEQFVYPSARKMRRPSSEPFYRRWFFMSVCWYSLGLTVLSRQHSLFSVFLRLTFLMMNGELLLLCTAQTFSRTVTLLQQYGFISCFFNNLLPEIQILLFFLPVFLLIQALLNTHTKVLQLLHHQSLWDVNRQVWDWDSAKKIQVTTITKRHKVTTINCPKSVPTGS